MKTLNLKITGAQKLGDLIVRIDEKTVKLKQNEFQNLTADVQTDNNKVKVEVYRALDVGGFWWFITQLFFFVISIFGILDIYAKNRYLSLEYESQVVLTEENSALTLKCNSLKDQATAFEVDTTLPNIETTNKFFVDTKAKKILKGLLIAKILLAIASVAAVIAVLIVKMI